MENASKALIMAAGILIGVLILSLAAYLIATFGASSAEIQRINEDKIIAEFNSQFTVYDGRNDLTIYDVLTVTSYAIENNNKYGLEFTWDNSEKDDYYITVNFCSASIECYDLGSFAYQLKKDNGEKYSCEVKINTTTKRVNKIIFWKTKY